MEEGGGTIILIHFCLLFVVGKEEGAALCCQPTLAPGDRGTHLMMPLRPQCGESVLKVLL